MIATIAKAAMGIESFIPKPLKYEIDVKAAAEAAA